MKKLLTVFCVLLLLNMGVSSTVFAQQRELSGTVLNSDGIPIKYATVQVVGTAQGISADEQGKFTITASPGQQLQVSSIGYETAIVKVGTSNNLVITLASSGNKLGEVVVTALGITRAKKTLGYAVQDLSSDELSGARDNNFINNIQIIT